MKKGAMKSTPETVMSVLACSPAAPPAPPKPNRISITKAFFRKLSLSAEQSWHQNSGANLRDVIRLLNMRASAGEQRGGRSCAHACYAPTLKESWRQNERCSN